MNRNYYAVLHMKNKDPQSTYHLGGKVVSCLTDNKVTYPQPDPTVEVIGNELTKLDLAIKAKDGTKQKNQVIADQTLVVYDLLKKELAYVNKVANGDRALILLSGFDSNNDPTYKNIPGKVYIKRVEDGSTVCSAKIYVEKLDKADRYKVEMTTTIEDPESWKIILDPASLYSIEVAGLPRGKDVYLRVTGGNSHGWGIPSDYVVFIPR